MSERKWKSPFLNWDEYNHDPNIAFTLVAKKEMARQMWSVKHNESRYVPSTFTRQKPEDQQFKATVSARPDAGNDQDQIAVNEAEATEPVLRFRFNDGPKNFAKGFVLGSDAKQCDALVGDPGGHISEQMLAFTFNKDHQLIMNVSSSKWTKWTFVTFNDQKVAQREQFSWIFPRHQNMIRVKAAGVLEFDVVLPKYGINEINADQNIETFLNLAASEGVLGHNLDVTADYLYPPDPFYLQEEKLGSGSYGDVVKVLRMPDGKHLAAKKFQNKSSFLKEVDILKKVCKIPHKYIVQFVEEWHEDHEPMLIMEYVAGGNLRQKIGKKMKFDAIMNIANQMLSALAFLHDQDVMHRDIKPENILCMPSNHYKLADFGVSREVAPYASRQGTEMYMAPEVLEWEPYGLPADMWSLGVVLAECMQCLPTEFRGLDHWCKNIVQSIKQCYAEIEADPASRGTEVSELVLFVTEAMLQLDADDRWSAQRCLAHPTLWKDLDCDGNSDAGDGAKTPTQAHPNGSSTQSVSESSGDDEAKEAGSLTIRKNGGGNRRDGQAPQDLSNEDRPAVRSRDTVEEFPSGPLIRGPTSEPFDESIEPIGGGAPYEPAHVEPYLDFVSDDEADEASVADANVKRKRGSQPSTVGNEEDVSGEVAAPGPEDGVVEAPPHPRANPAKHDAKRSRIRKTI